MLTKIHLNLEKIAKNTCYFDFFGKFSLKHLQNQKKEVPLQPQIDKGFALNSGIWCNGNTTDSGPVIPGSNPGIPTKNIINTCILVN